MNSIANILKYTYSYEPNENIPEILSMIDTIIAILFLTSTNIKTKYIYDATLDDFNKLHTNFDARLVIKDKRIMVFPLLATRAFNKIKDLLEYKNSNFEAIGANLSSESGRAAEAGFVDANSISKDSTIVSFKVLNILF